MTARGAAVRVPPSRTGVRGPAARTTADRKSAAAGPPPTATRAPVGEPRPALRLLPDLPSARPRTRSVPTQRRAPFVLLVVALLVGTTLGLLFLNTAIGVDAIKATELRAANAELAQDVQGLQQRVVKGSTPAALAAAAVRAGLVPAGPAAYLVLTTDGGANLRGVPRPAPEPEPTTGAAPDAGRVPTAGAAAPADGG